jgi:hypothetical protein
VLRRALEACILGQADALPELFTTDVSGWSPNLLVGSLDELTEVIGDREDVRCEPFTGPSLSELDLDGEHLLHQGRRSRSGTRRSCPVEVGRHGRSEQDLRAVEFDHEVLADHERTREHSAEPVLDEAFVPKTSSPSTWTLTSENRSVIEGYPAGSAARWYRKNL